MVHIIQSIINILWWKRWKWFDMARKYTSLRAFLKDADERVKEAAVQALNESAEQLKQDIKSNMVAVGIKNRTGQLQGSIKFLPATVKRLNVIIKSEVYKPAPRRPGWRNPRMKGRYKKGVPYGRIIEFSPRINKPFFYKAWYKNRKAIKDKVMETIGNAWSGK